MSSSAVKISSPFTMISWSRLSLVLRPCCSSLHSATVLPEDHIAVRGNNTLHTHTLCIYTHTLRYRTGYIHMTAFSKNSKKKKLELYNIHSVIYLSKYLSLDSNIHTYTLHISIHLSTTYDKVVPDTWGGGRGEERGNSQTHSANWAAGVVFGSGYSSPDFALVLAVEQVLAAHPLSHDKLQRRLPCWTREAAQKLQQRTQLGVDQVGKHQDRKSTRLNSSHL